MRTRTLTIIAFTIAAAAPLDAQQAPPSVARPPRAPVAPAHVTMPVAGSPAPYALVHVSAAPLPVPSAPAAHAPASPAPAAPPAPGPAAAADDFVDFDVSSPEPWAPQDPGDSLYRAARRALNDGDYARAAQLFSRLHGEARFRGSEYRALAYYYEALARTRVGGRAELQRARSSLEAMRQQHAEAWRAQRDAASLMTRVDAELARLGDASAARAVQVRVNAATRDACTDANMAVKVEALNALLQMDAASAMPILEEVMKNKSSDACVVDLRRRALFLVSQQRTDTSADILLDAAENDPDPEVQEQAVFWLSQVNNEKAITALESILKSSKSPKLQERAVFAISQHRSQRAVDLLRDYALRTDIPAELRGNAIMWLGQHPNADNGRFLRELYPRVSDQAVKEKVLFAVSQVRGEESADWLLARALDQNESVEIRKNALFWSSQQRALPIARLSELYDRVPDRALKEQVLFGLSQRAREPEAVDLLMKIARTEKEPELRKNAIFWLGQSRDPRAAAFLLELIKN